MNNVAVIFSHGPYGNSSTQEGLEFLLSISTFSKKTVGVFFISDGVFFLLANQKSSLIQVKNFISTLSALPIYGVSKIYLCAYSARTRGLKYNTDFILTPKWLTILKWQDIIKTFDVILTF